MDGIAIASTALAMQPLRRAVKTNKSSAVAEMGDRGHNRHERKEGDCCAPFAGAETRLVQCGLGRGLLPYQTGSSSIQPFGHNRHGPKIWWGVCVSFFLGVAGSTIHIEHNVAQAEAYLHTKWHLDPCSYLATIDVGRKLGGVRGWVPI